MGNCRFVGQICKFTADLQNLAIEKQAFKSAKHQAQIYNAQPTWAADIDFA